MDIGNLHAAALIYGRAFHHLDHLGPLSQILGIPIFVTDDDVYSAAKAYYPTLQLHLSTTIEIASQIVERFEILFTCLAQPIVEEVFFFAEAFARKKIASIWCPHGQSDKGHQLGFMRALENERSILVYGPKMHDVLISCGVTDRVKTIIETGNFRWEDYQNHRNFYDEIARNKITRRLPQAARTLLFAPTWKDGENSTSFLDAYQPLIEHLPADTNLIVKLHPNLLIQEEWRIEQIKERFASHPHVLFLDQFPHIYSLLSLSDVYIGDMSSIGYDFLTFDRPMIFLNQDRHPSENLGLSLHRCGISLTPDEYPLIHQKFAEIYPFDQKLFSETRKAAYAYTFGPSQPISTIRKTVERSYPAIVYEDFEL